MCACVHAHAGDRGQASREATCGRVDRHVLYTLPVQNPGEPLIHQRRVVLKPRLIVQYYLGGTLVALEISRLNIFNSLSCDSPLSKRIEKGECILLCIFKENNTCEAAYGEWPCVPG